MPEARYNGTLLILDAQQSPLVFQHWQPFLTSYLYQDNILISHPLNLNRTSFCSFFTIVYASHCINRISKGLFLTFPPDSLYQKVNNRGYCIDLLEDVKSFIKENHSYLDLSGTHPFLCNSYPKELARGGRGYKQMLVDLDRAIADSNPEAVTSSVDIYIFIPFFTFNTVINCII